MAFYDKIKWVLGILIIFVLIVTTNLIDRNNFLRVRDSVATVYEDRLVANDLIFEITRAVHQKELAAVEADSLFFLERNGQVNTAITEWVTKFGQTKLTPEEAGVFASLKGNLEALKDSETAYVQAGFTQNQELLAHLSRAGENLYKLSKIQLQEGGRQIGISKKAIDSVELFTQIEIYFLIFLAIVIQVIVIYQPRKRGPA